MEQKFSGAESREVKTFQTETTLALECEILLLRSYPRTTFGFMSDKTSRTNTTWAKWRQLRRVLLCGRHILLR